MVASVVIELTAVGLGLLAVRWNGTARPGPAPASAMAWRACGAAAECATLPVPADHARPTGPTIDLSLARHRAQDPAARRGVLLINLGGPGIRGTDQITDPAKLVKWPSAVRQHFDLIGFDPRGVPGSSYLHCGPHEPWRTRPRGSAEFDRKVTARGAWLRDCASRTGDLFNHLDGRSVAADVEAIRVALGEEKINWIGYSYGTLFGLTYAEMFPNRIRAMVLDGVVDHSTPTERLAVTRAVATEHAFNDFAKWCAGESTCALHGRDVGALWDGLAKRAGQAPVDVDGTSYSDDALAGAVVERVTSARDWPELAGLLAKASPNAASQPAPNRPTASHPAASHPAGGRSAASRAAESPHPAPDFNVGAMIDVGDCSDYPSRLNTFNEISAFVADIVRQAPRFGSFVGWQDLGKCAQWPFPVPNPPGPIELTDLPPVLLVNATGDAVTPLTDARTVAGQLPGSSSVMVDADEHGVYGYGVKCADTAVERFLVDLARPPDPTDCDGSPLVPHGG